jgi:cytochrome c oxidase cbb3-type subunit III
VNKIRLRRCAPTFLVRMHCKFGDKCLESGESDRMHAGARFYIHARKSLAVFAWTFLTVVLASHALSFANPSDHGGEGKNDDAQNLAVRRNGEATYRPNCGFCHGNDARGENGAPDLTLPRTQRRTDVELLHIILDGRPGTEMPANDLSERETREVIAYLRGLRPSSTAAVAGDPEAGRRIFLGQCSGCHMINGTGGRLGPDLSRIAISRTRPYIVESIRQPSKVLAIAMMPAVAHETPVRYQTITVITNDGRRITGVRKNEDGYSVQLMTQGEELLAFLKKDVREVIHEPTSLMPQYSEEMLNNKDLRDLVSFFEKLGGR